MKYGNNISVIPTATQIFDDSDTYLSVGIKLFLQIDAP